MKAVVAAGVSAVMQKKKEMSKLVEESAAVAGNPNEPAESAAKTARAETDRNQDEVAALAYKMWQERGCPIGSDQEDWFRAENELVSRTALEEGAS